MKEFVFHDPKQRIASFSVSFSRGKKGLRPSVMGGGGYRKRTLIKRSSKFEGNLRSGNGDGTGIFVKRTIYMYNILLFYFSRSTEFASRTLTAAVVSGT